MHIYFLKLVKHPPDSELLLEIRNYIDLQNVILFSKE